MDILIENMEMPKGCSWFDKEDKYHSCRFLFGYICTITGKCIATSVEGRHPSCPLIPIPEHGDLIERDVLANSIPEAELYAFGNCAKCTCMTKDEMVEIIMDAEVVLEANK